MELLSGNICRVKCRDINKNGHGVSSCGESIVFTPGLIPGEEAIIKLTYKKGTTWFSEINQILKVSNERRIPTCENFVRCGGCSIQHLEYKLQKQSKLNNLKHNLINIGNISNPVNPIISNESEFVGYRNRSIIPIEYVNNSTKMGYYELNTNKIVDINSCEILDIRMQLLINSIKDEMNYIMGKYKVELPVKYVALRLGYYTDQILVTLITSIEPKEMMYKLANNIFNTSQSIKGVTYNLTSPNTNKIFGDVSGKLIGQDYIHDYFLGNVFTLTTTDFFQINTILAEKAVKMIVSWFKDIQLKLPIIDAYCGVGTISIPLASYGLSVIGIEKNPSAVRQGVINARENNISDLQFICGDVSKFIGQYLSVDSYLVIDPPRKGIDKHSMNCILNQKPNRIAYLSCNSATLSRDLALLTANNLYIVKMIQPYDFFPNTTHLEVLVFLTLSGPDVC